ncbi:L-amino-acid oxidase, partial [Microtus ochrogaster]
PHSCFLCPPGIFILGILLSISNCLAFYEDLFRCFQGPDYENFLLIAENGLHASPLPKSVVVIGAGLAGLAAAKTLQDAGHKPLIIVNCHSCPYGAKNEDYARKSLRTPEANSPRKVILHVHGLQVRAYSYLEAISGMGRKNSTPKNDSSFFELQVTILEASNHIGGRVVTVRNKTEGWYFELGPMRIPESHKLTHAYVKKFGLKMNKFIQHDNNTWYLFNGQRYRAWEVEANPEILGYSTDPTEKNKTAQNLFDQAVIKIKQDVKTSNCSQLMSLYDSYSTKAYLVREGKLSKGATKMIGDLLNEDPGYHKSLLESLKSHKNFSRTDEFSEITGGFDQLPNGFNARLKSGTIRMRSRVEAVATRLITFQPPLSPDKAHALRSVHYTSATKVVFVCNECFWEQDGIRGGNSITDRPSRYIIYPSHSLPGGKGMLLASYTVDDDSFFFAAMKPDQVVNIILDDLAAVHHIPKEELKRMCPKATVKHWGSLDPLTIGAFAEFTPYQFVDDLKELSQPEGPIHFAGEHTDLPHGWIDTAIKSGLRAAKDIQAMVDEEVTQGQMPR